MQTVAIQGTLRTELGKKATKATRAEGLVPCVIYGQGGNVHFSAPTLAFRDIVYTPDFKIAEITVDGTTHRAFLKELQFDPVTDSLMHIDFVALVPGHKFTTQVPVILAGVAPGVKVGGKLMQVTRRVKIKTTPEHLVDALTVDISTLELGKSVRIRDIQALEGVEIIASPGIPIATVEIPRALRSAQTAAAKTEKGGKKK
jgi:large subunit ribosomal protein L25